jgi:hypothetical protein
MLNRDFRDVLSGFNAEGVEYLVVGAYALAAHGLPRATGDLDLWIARSPENAARIWIALEKFGAHLRDLSIDDFQKANQVIQIGISPSRIDILTSIDAVEFEPAWARRVTLTASSVTFPVISKADLIANKRATGRPQDIADVARLTSSIDKPEIV